MQVARHASHAGTWYERRADKLEKQLTKWLEAVKPTDVPIAPRSVIDGSMDRVDGSGSSDTQGRPVQMPVANLKAIIGPHAGYDYSGPAAAWAYRCIDPTAYDRVFILGPSHHFYFDSCALSGCDVYDTPLGELKLDDETREELRQTGKFAKDMELSVDEDEHSIEMHLPYIRQVFADHPTVKIVPILVGSISATKEAAFGKLLAPYLADDRTLFIVSSDFCHWGSRFRFTPYRTALDKKVRTLNAQDKLLPEWPPIHASIRAMDGEAIAKLTFPQILPTPDPSSYKKDGQSSADDAASPPSSLSFRTAKDAQRDFTAYLRETNNTICGRHPIGVLLGALAALEAEGTTSQLSFTRYEQSSAVEKPRDSSVSYASAFVRFTGGAAAQS